MADDGTAANGFGRWSLRKHEAWALYLTGYPCPPDMRVPDASDGQGPWALSVGGISVPPVPFGADFEYTVEEARAILTEEHAADPRWRVEGNDAFWTLYFQRRCQQDLQSAGNNGPVSGRHNCNDRKQWWGDEGGRLEQVLAYIAGGNEPRLEMPPRRSS